MDIQVGETLISLDSIETIHAYKADLLTLDEIRFEIKTANFYYTVTEEDEIFEELDKLLGENLDGDLRDWRNRIMYPPFKKNTVKIYERVTS